MANRIQRMVYGASVCAAGLALALAFSPLVAAPGTLSYVPLFATTNVPPNIVLIIDDSGSMDSEAIFFTNDAALWWNTTTPEWSTATPPTMTTRGWTYTGVDGPYTTAIAGKVSFNRSGAANDTWKKYVYLFPNGTGAGKRVYADSTNDHYAVPPLPQYAFARSPDYNASYFDPAVTYGPWPSYGTTTYSDITPTSAPSDPVSGTGATLNLTTNQESSSTNETFKMFDGMTVTAGAYYKIGAGAWGTASSDVPITTASDVAIRYYPATYYLTLGRTLGGTVPTGSYTYTIAYPIDGTPATATVSGDCASATPSSAHYDLFHQHPGSFTATPSTASGHAIIGLGPDGQCLVEYQIAAGATQMQNFANWFSYYRKRHLALRGGIVSAFQNVTGIRGGVYTINNSVTSLLPPLDISTVGSANQNAFFSTIYSIDGHNSDSTPNRQALDTIGTDFPSYVLAESQGGHCQKNLAIQFTDGFSTLAGIPTMIGNTDGDDGAPYADTDSNTLADIAMKYYEENLKSTLPHGKVPVLAVCPAPTSCSATTCRSTSTTHPTADCNRNLHMNTITVGIGAYGTIFNSPLTDPPFFYQTVANAHATPPTWPDVNTERDPRQIDDLYHAAVNGRGEILNARTPAGLTTAMQNAVKTVFAQASAATAVTFNTSWSTNANTVFLSLFNAADWSGDVRMRAPPSASF
jgi:type IV pilus assembly protein PilY1